MSNVDYDNLIKEVIVFLICMIIYTFFAAKLEKLKVNF